MKSALAWIVCLGALAAVDADTTSGHPIEKVINMLKGLKAKAIVEGKQEEQSFAKFAYWCKTSISTLKDAIAEETEKIAELEDLISGKTKEKEVLEEEIEKLTDQIADMEAAAAKAKKQRKDEEDLYKKELGDLKGTIKAVDDAMKALQSAESKTEPGLLQARSHVQKLLSLIAISSATTESQLNTLQAFANQRPKQLAEGDLDAHVDKYDFKSENVIELLKQLKLKFQDDKLKCTTEETNAVNAYELAKQARDNAIAAAAKSKKKKEVTLADVNDLLKSKKAELADQEADKKADSKSLKDTEEQCSTKKQEWEERSTTRTKEIEAMDMAVKILGKATGVRTEAPGNPVPPASPVAFLQVGSSSSGSQPKMAAVALIREAAKNSHSRALERLAMEVSSHLTGPFDQVNNMIEKMIFRLMDEQRQEDEHKAWCDQELKKTNVMKTDKEDKIADLKAEIKAETAAIAKLTEEITEANEMIADIVAFKKEATEIREIGKKENKKAIADAEVAQKAVADAIAVLTDFYKSSGEIAKEPWEFIQKPVELPENPKTWDSPYTGVADPDKQPAGIITILENVMEDFSRMEAETKSQEAADQKEYDQSMSDNDIEKARRTQEADMKSNEKKRRAEKVAVLSGQKKDTEAELEKTEQYLKDLEPACVSGDSTYEDRKKARTGEIDALKKAQIILRDAFAEKPASFLQIRRK